MATYEVLSPEERLDSTLARDAAELAGEVVAIVDPVAPVVGVDAGVVVVVAVVAGAELQALTPRTTAVSAMVAVKRRAELTSVLPRKKRREVAIWFISGSLLRGRSRQRYDASELTRVLSHVFELGAAVTITARR